MENSMGKPGQTQTGQRSRKPSGEQRKEILKRLYALSESTGEACSVERADIYIQSLSDLDHGKLLIALESMIKTARFFPKIPDIREAVIGHPGDDAWQKMVARVDGWRDRLELEADAVYSGFSCGREISKFDVSGLDPVARLALTRLGGPRALACANPAHLPLIRKDFLSEYRAIVVEHPHLLMEAPQTIAGLLEEFKPKGFKQ